jgi:hypothetical protein
MKCLPVPLYAFYPVSTAILTIVLDKDYRFKRRVCHCGKYPCRFFS